MKLTSQEQRILQNFRLAPESTQASLDYFLAAKAAKAKPSRPRFKVINGCNPPVQIPQRKGA